MDRVMLRKRMLGWIVASSAAKKIFPRLIERTKQKKVIGEFRIGRIGAAAAAAGADVDVFLQHLGASGSVSTSLHGRISSALTEYAGQCDRWRNHLHRCEQVFWKTPAENSSPDQRILLHQKRRSLSHQCRRPAELFDFLLRRPDIARPVKFSVPQSAAFYAKFREELARPELLFSAPAKPPDVCASHGIAAVTGVQEYLVRFASPSRFTGDLVYARVVEPENPPPQAPTVLYCGPFGMAYDQLTSWPEEKYLARPLAQRGCRVILMEAPWHGRRTPAGYSSGEYFLATSPNGCIEFLSAQVQELAAVSSWARSRWSGPVLFAGMSLGAMAVQQATAWCHTWPAGLRPDTVLLCATGLYPERIIRNSSLSNGLGIGRELTRAGWSEADFRAAGRLFEPGVRPCIEPERILLVLGRYDMIVPYAYGRELATFWKLPIENIAVWKAGHIGVLTDMLRTPQGRGFFKRAVDLSKRSQAK